MSSPKVNYSITGDGPYIFCLHSSTGSAKQWSVLTELLSNDYTIVAPDLYGYGKSPDWDKNRALELEDEIELLKPIIDEIPCNFHLIGHSYGAAVAFKLAQLYPKRIRSLIAYEPVLFNLLFEMKAMDPASEIWIVADDVYWLLVDKRYDDAARRFIDYWTGDGVWDSFPGWQQEAIKKRMMKVTHDFDAVLGNQTSLCEYSKLHMPILYLYGQQSPNSTQQIAQFLGKVLPKAEVRALLPLGHMGPVTHAESINKIIMKFINNLPKGIPVHYLRSEE